MSLSLFCYLTPVYRIWCLCLWFATRLRSTDSGVSVFVLLLDSVLQTPVSLSLFCYSTPVYRLCCLCLCSDIRLRLQCLCLCSDTSLRSTDSGISVFVLLLIPSGLPTPVPLSLFCYSTLVSINFFYDKMRPKATILNTFI